MAGNGLKNKYLNKKIIIHQMTLLDRVLGLGSAIFLTALPIIVLILGFEPVYKMIVLLLAMIVYCLFMFFNVFKTYILLDKKNNKLIIRETLGFKKEELFLENIVRIEVADGVYTKKFFTIDIILRGASTKKIGSWSDPLTSRVSIFGTYKRQTKRLKKFCEECNQYLQEQKE
ncbi:MAG: hypothetical protein IKC33_00125 [Clostridia bacterium]|nr:hypothetical protein [Clostridia bacterium]MBR2932701.1 hypothetical protein [Clostridia bacterium]MBR6688152.1 hypothetical protein [Clostridia bacterium]